MSNKAWVTLATNDSYGLGALVLAHSLRQAGTQYPAVVLITPSVTDAMRERLRAVFAEVVTVDVLDSRDATHLALLQRPELGITFTKIHCWNLTQYEKCVFLDADTLVVQNCDELFEREELSAAPDVGWPDCFNSGVFVFSPSAETFTRLVAFAQERGSFDGGDQGLLNSFFSDWARGDINKHLPFLYNVTSAAFYSYLPALKHYGQDLKIIHFIGAAKPWLQHFNFESRSVDAPDHLRGFLQLWWNIFTGQVHTQLDTTMSGVAGNLARVVPGASSYEALDDLTRRQGWEAGNIDYMGADSFDKIWAKISQTLNQPRVTPPKETSPPKESQVAEATKASEVVELAKEATPVQREASAEPVKEKVPEVTPPAPEPTLAPEPVKVEKPEKAPEQPGAVEAVKVAEPEAIKPVKSAAPSESAPAPEPVKVPETPAQSVPEIPKQLATEKPVETPVPAAAKTTEAKPVEAVAEPKKTETEGKTETPVADAPVQKSEVAVVETPKAVEQAPASPVKAEEAPASPAKPEETPAKPGSTPEAKSSAVTDSPPLANTPSKEQAPPVPDAKSEERRKPAGKLQLGVPAASDPLPTPDSELEDAATLAQAIIATELRTPTITGAPESPASPPLPKEPRNLTVEEPQVPTPPVGAVSLAQIGVKPKEKATIAEQIESSVAATAPPTPPTPTSPAPAEAAPKKKVVKKVVKKEAAAAGDGSAPVPPPRKKEKKPKEK